MAILSFYITPIIVCSIVLLGLSRRLPIFEIFSAGVKEGLASTVAVAPSIIGLLVAVSMLKASGAIDIFCQAIRPLTDALHIPNEVVPMLFLRPISGSGSLAFLDSLLKTAGPDSFAGRAASVIMGSTETTFYTLAVYFGAIGVKNFRHAIPSALFADLAGFVMSILWVNFMFYR